jgi:hypothetical protein
VPFEELHFNSPRFTILTARSALLVGSFVVRFPSTPHASRVN